MFDRSSIWVVAQAAVLLTTVVGAQGARCLEISRSYRASGTASPFPAPARHRSTRPKDRGFGSKRR